MTGPGLSHPVPTWLARLSRIARLHGRAGPAAFPHRRSVSPGTRRSRRARAALGRRAAPRTRRARARRGWRPGMRSRRSGASAACGRWRGTCRSESEIDPLPAMLALAGLGYRVACRWSRAPAGRWRSAPGRRGRRPSAGAFGVEVPVGRRRAAEPDVLLVPMLAFDARGAPARLRRRLLRPHDRRAPGAARGAGARLRLCGAGGRRRCRMRRPTCGSTRSSPRRAFAGRSEAWRIALAGGALAGRPVRR